MVPRIPIIESEDEGSVDGALITGDEDSDAEVKININNKTYQDSLRRDARTDPLIYARLVKESPGLRDWVTETFGEEVLVDEDQVGLEPSDDESEGTEGVVQDADDSEREEESKPKKMKVNKLVLGARKGGLFTRIRKAARKAARTVKTGGKLANGGNLSRPPVVCNHNAPKGPPDETRLEETTLETDNGRIHTLVAVTQGLLNSRLKYLWVLEEEMQSMHVSLENGEEIKSFLLPPKIHLEVEIDRPGAAVYYLFFDYGGHIKLLDEESEDGFRTIPVEGWRFAFDIDIELEDVEDDTEEANAIKEKLGQKGDFRISRLLADFTTADILNPRLDLCTFDGIELDERTMEGLKSLLDRWRDQAVEDGLGIMGWSATTNKPESVQGLPPTFTPTDQQLQTYPYLPPGQEKPVVGLDNETANYNMLLYLNMTNNEAFPKDRFLDYGGNWCTPNTPVVAPKMPETHATMCIGKDVFFKSFILPNLAYLNKASWVEAKKPGITFKRLGVIIKWNKTFGGKDSNFYNDWKPASGDGWVGWSWYKVSEGRHKRKKGINGTAEAIMRTKVKNVVRILPKGNIIRVDHTTRIELRTYHSRLKRRHGIVETERKGTIHIYIESVEDGQNMKLRFPVPKDLFTSRIIRCDTNFIGKKSTIEREADSYTSLLKNSNDFKQGVNKIQSAMQQVGAFVIPSGGTFFLRDGLFNDECDLMLKASYNGVD